MESISRIAERFVTCIKRKGLRPIELFSEYDRANLGLISIDNFRRAFAQIGFWCPDSDFSILRELYETNKGITYRTFCEDISEDGTITKNALSHKEILSQTDLIQFSHYLITKGINLWDIMIEYDTRRLGTVPYNTFLRAFSTSIDLIQDVARAYCNASREVNYIQLQKDLDQIISGQQRNIEEYLSMVPSYFNDFVRALRSKGGEIIDIFLTRDKLKRGILPMNSFLAVLSSYNLPFSPTEMEEIAYPFSHQGYIDYKMFCQAVDIISERIAQQSARRTKPEPTPDLDSILQEIKQRIIIRRCLVGDQLQDADRNAGGRLQRLPFYKILSYNGFSFNANEVRALDRAFLRQDGSIDVNSFISLVVPPEIKPVEISLDDLLNKVKSILQDKRISLRKYFASFDRGDSGVISSIQLISAFNGIGYPLNVQEVKLLNERFGIGQLLDWKALADIVEPPKPIPTLATMISNTMKPVEKQKQTPAPVVLKMLSLISTLANMHNVNLFELCLARDFKKTGLISVMAFKGILSTLRMFTSTNELNTLIEFYSDPSTNDVQYANFCEDLTTYGDTKPEEPIQTRQEPPRPRAKSSQLLGALQNLKAALVFRRLSPEELFREHDYQHCGCVYNDKDLH